ncbi:DUF1294 domain-containing protein [Paenibacillus tarimensis]
METLFFYMSLINIVSFAFMGYDKKQAGRRKRRIPEKRLFALAAAGGAIGAWTGMFYWRHKTKHPAFVYGIPVLTIWNLAAIWGIFSLK